MKTSVASPLRLGLLLHRLGAATAALRPRVLQVPGLGRLRFLLRGFSRGAVQLTRRRSLSLWLRAVAVAAPLRLFEPELKVKLLLGDFPLLQLLQRAIIVVDVVEILSRLRLASLRRREAFLRLGLLRRESLLLPPSWWQLPVPRPVVLLDKIPQ